MKYLMDMSYGKNNDIRLIFYDEITKKLVYKNKPIKDSPPYFISNKKDRKTRTIRKTEPITKKDFFNSSNLSLFKHYVTQPNEIPTVSKLYYEKWENHIRYLDRWRFDNNYIMGLPYDDNGNPIINNDIPDILRKALDKHPEHLINRFVPLFQTRLPDLPVIAFDIEVDYDKDRIPDIENPNKIIISASFTNSDGNADIFMLQRTVQDNSNSPEPIDANIHMFDSEAMMIKAIFDYISESKERVIVTYNGDQFDFPYLYYRAMKFKIPNSTIPVFVYKSRNGSFKVKLHQKFHLDLYAFLSNPAIKTYVFNNAYKFNALDDVLEALLGTHKYDVGEIKEASLERLAYYNWIDTVRLIDLINHDDRIILYMAFLFMRIGNISFEDATRRYVSKPIGNMFLSYLIDHNILIPNKDQLYSVGSASTTSMIADKKYKGARVEATRGIFFNVTAPDFASLYPSAMYEYNISPDTINCGHEECKDNLIYETTHYTCKKKKGVASQIVGFFRDLRVNFYKKRKKENEMNAMIERGLKVYINASYGVFPSESFPLSCVPVGDCTTAVGRQAFNLLKSVCEKLNVTYIGGDSVAGDEPIIIKKNNIIQVRQIQSITKDDFPFQVLSDNGFTPVKHLMKHEVKKEMYMIRTVNGTVEVTGDHSLVLESGKEIKPSELNIGDKLLCHNLHIDLPQNNFDNNLAFVYGFFAGGGTCSKNSYGKPSYTKYNFHFSNSNLDYLNEIRNKIPYETKLYDIRESSSVYRLQVKNPSKYIDEWREKFYTLDGKKKVPNCILNADLEAKKEFLRGYMLADGSKNDKYIGREFTTNSKSLATSLLLLFKQVRGKNFNVFYRKSKNVWRIRIYKTNLKSNNTVKKIIPLGKKKQVVYDLETENHHFQAGVGGIIVHNTDSSFIETQDTNKLNLMKKILKEEMNLDLDYSEDEMFIWFAMYKKKNYIALHLDKKMMIKGMTGKKKHIPNVLRVPFNRLKKTMKDIRDKDDVGTFINKAKKIAFEGYEYIEKSKKYEDFAFKVVLGKDLDNYAVNNEYVKAGRKIINAGKGSIVRYIKGKNEPYVLSEEKIIPDRKKYITLLNKNMDQIFNIFNIKADDIYKEYKKANLFAFFN